MGSAEVVVDDVVAVLEAVGAAEEVEVEEGEADQEIGPAKTAVIPTLPGGRPKQLHIAVQCTFASTSHTACCNSSLNLRFTGMCATSVRHQSLEEAVEEVVVAVGEVEALVVVGTETVEVEEIGMEVGEVTGTEVGEDMTETEMEVDMVAAAEVLIEEAMAGTGIDHTDRDNLDGGKIILRRILPCFYSAVMSIQRIDACSYGFLVEQKCRENAVPKPYRDLQA